MHLLTVTGLSKHYGARTVLRDVAFSVRQGEVLGLIGPNGAGKTTLFESLAGLTPTNGGTLQWRAYSLTATQRKETLFYLPDGIAPWAAHSVGWALQFFARLYGRRGQNARRAAELYFDEFTVAPMAK